MSDKIIRKTERGSVEIFVINGEKRIRRTVDYKCPVYEALKNVCSEYLPKIYSVKIADGRTVAEEEFIEGKSLAAANLTEKQAVRAMLSLCSAMDFIHGLGIVHRDIKPSNIMMTADGSIKLIDFEAARIVKSGSDKDTRYLGTEGFAPPEQYGFSQTDIRADIYAAGQTFKVLLGSLSAKAAYRKIILKCTELDPKKRYSNAKSLMRAIQLSRIDPLAAVSAVVGIAAAVVFAAVPKDSAVPVSYVQTKAVLDTQTEAVSDTQTEAVSDTQTEAVSVSQTETTSEVSETETLETEAVTTWSGAVNKNVETKYTDSEGKYPPVTDMDGNSPYYIQEHKKEYIIDYYGDLTSYGEPENLPEYKEEDLLFLCGDDNAKILLADGNALLKDYTQFYFYDDLDGDGLNEAVSVYVNLYGELFVDMTYGMPSDEGYTGADGLNGTTPNGGTILDFDESYFVQVTSFTTAYYEKYFAVTVGDRENFNYTGFFTADSNGIHYAGKAWGETLARFVHGTLGIFLSDGRSNKYLLYDGELHVQSEFDYLDYQEWKKQKEHDDDIPDVYNENWYPDWW